MTQQWCLAFELSEAFTLPLKWSSWANEGSRQFLPLWCRFGFVLGRTIKKWSLLSAHFRPNLLWSTVLGRFGAFLGRELKMATFWRVLGRLGLWPPGIFGDPPDPKSDPPGIFSGPSLASSHDLTYGNMAVPAHTRHSVHRKSGTLPDLDHRSNQGEGRRPLIPWNRFPLWGKEGQQSATASWLTSL